MTNEMVWKKESEDRKLLNWNTPADHVLTSLLLKSGSLMTLNPPHTPHTHTYWTFSFTTLSSSLFSSYIWLFTADLWADGRPPTLQMSAGSRVWRKTMTADTIQKIKWTFIIHRHLYLFIFLDYTHITFFLWQTHLALLWVQSKSKQTVDCGLMCVNLKKQGKRHVKLHIITLIFKEY